MRKRLPSGSTAAERPMLVACRAVRPPVDTIQAPPFPAGLPWVNVAPLRMDRQLGRPVLIEFWDFCRVNSLRTLPYVGEWHRRYADDGLRVIGVHSPGFEPSSREDSVREAVTRLGVEHPVVIDGRLEIWDLYGNEGWPARYLFDQRGILFDVHMGEGAHGAVGECTALVCARGTPKETCWAECQWVIAGRWKRGKFISIVIFLVS